MKIRPSRADGCWIGVGAELGRPKSGTNEWDDKVIANLDQQGLRLGSRRLRRFD